MKIKKVTEKDTGKGFTVKQLMEFAKSISKKAETDKNYKEIIKVASEKWEKSCCYGIK